MLRKSYLLPSFSLLFTSSSHSIYHCNVILIVPNENIRFCTFCATAKQVFNSMNWKINALFIINIRNRNKLV